MQTKTLIEKRINQHATSLWFIALPTLPCKKNQNDDHKFGTKFGRLRPWAPIMKYEVLLQMIDEYSEWKVGQGFKFCH